MSKSATVIIIKSRIAEGKNTIHALCQEISPDKAIYGAVSKAVGIATFKPLAKEGDHIDRIAEAIQKEVNVNSEQHV